MTQTIFAAIRYRDANAAIEFLKAAFGATEKAVYRDDAGTVQHGELMIEGSVVMLGQRDDAGPGNATMSLYVVVADPDAHHAAAVGAGATVTRELEDMDYGSREYGVEDCEGNGWSFGTYDPLGA